MIRTTSVFGNEHQEMSFDEMFPNVNVEALSLDDSFLRYVPQTNEGKFLKKNIKYAIITGMRNFRVPALAPSEDENGNIFFKIGEKPAYGHSAVYWDEKVQQMFPGFSTRMGMVREYCAFLGVVIKELIEEGYPVETVWEAVSNNSIKLGNYRNSFEGKQEEPMPTGSVKVGKWYDLANLYKYLKKDNGKGFMRASGSFSNYSYNLPLAFIMDINVPNDAEKFSGVPFIVMRELKK